MTVFKSDRKAAITLRGIELAHRISKTPVLVLFRRPAAALVIEAVLGPGLGLENNRTSPVSLLLLGIRACTRTSTTKPSPKR
jgi:hypothetical protein